MNWFKVMVKNSIGGYFELMLDANDNVMHYDSKKFQSARSAFYALINCLKPRKIWMPRYICDSMLLPLLKSGVEISYYSLNIDFSIKENITLFERDYIFYVNYFGVCDSIFSKLKLSYGNDKLIYDCSQAFFCNNSEGVSTIYSPRKFFPVSDGGYLKTSLNVATPETTDMLSPSRFTHLLLRADQGSEAGYNSFLDAEESLNDIIPKKMSLLTKKLLNSFDYKKIQISRNRNFMTLHDSLKENNMLVLSDSYNAPLVYPFFIENAQFLRDKLIRSNIYPATYWKDVLKRVSTDSFEFSLVQNLLPLPIDQRYCEEDMNYILEILSIERVGR